MAFLKPTGVERPLDISRWVWDSEVRAPMAVQLMRSPMYWGVLGSRASVAVGRPTSADAEQERPGLPHALLDVEGIVHAGVVDEPLPTRGGARLLEVDPHH